MNKVAYYIVQIGLAGENMAKGPIMSWGAFDHLTKPIKEFLDKKIRHYKRGSHISYMGEENCKGFPYSCKESKCREKGKDLYLLKTDLSIKSTQKR